ncbi:hypothetical protein GCM10011326_44730 [Salipiger profundus]|nr:hypothetical protein GCM10011326_44730 [Salipiger profundus]
MALGGGCIPLLGIQSEIVARASCWPMIARAWEMAELPKFSTIVIGGAWNSYILDPGGIYDYKLMQENGELVSIDTEEGFNLVLQQLEEGVRYLRSIGKRVVLVLDNPAAPEFNITGPRYRLNPFSNQLTPLMRVAVSSEQVNVHDRMVAFAERLNIDYIDPFVELCEGYMCLATDDNAVPIYKDSTHFNPQWALSSATFIDRLAE